jgi:NO-binding membrane sensor protein with MHYT domain
MPKAPRRPDPPPLETDDRPVVIAGMALWAVAFVVLVVFFRDVLRRHHASFWLWSCLIGIALGLYALRFVSRRQRNR